MFQKTERAKIPFMFLSDFYPYNKNLNDIHFSNTSFFLKYSLFDDANLKSEIFMV